MHGLSRPAIYTLELTAACQNRCLGCSNPYAANRSTSHLSAPEWESLLSILAPGAVRIRLSGGEPTLHPDFVRIVHAAASYNAQVTVFTNGRWPAAPSLMNHVRSIPSLSGLLISLHGASPAVHDSLTGVPGSFAETVGNARLAIGEGVAVALCAVISRLNWRDIAPIADLGRQLGVQHVAFNRYLGPPQLQIEPSVRQLRSAVAAIEALAAAGEPVRYGECIPPCFEPNRSSGCFAGLAHLSVDPVGNARPCHHSSVVVGSLLAQPLDALWHGEAMNAWRARIPSKCRLCTALTECQGGCRAAGEWHQVDEDPLSGEPISAYTPIVHRCELPADARPMAAFQIRPEPFGYVLLGRGQFLEVTHAARIVVEACDGRATFAQLAGRFGQPGIDLLGEMWASGLIEAAPPDPPIVT